MKMLISVLIATLSSVNAFADRDVEIDCKLNISQSAVVERVQLYSATDEIKIQYRNGTAETVKPVDSRNEGIFGTEDFSTDVVWSNGQVFSPTTAVGPIYIRYGCYLTPTVSFERCISQGSRETAQFAGVRMNLGGKVLTFFGEDICTRNDRSSL